MKKIIVAALLLLTNFAFAQMPNLTKGTYVTDFTHTLTTDRVADLNQRAAEIYKKSSIQLIIVVMDALPKNVNVNDATSYIDEKWISSNTDTTNRLVYVAGLKQHGHRLSAVRGMRGLVLFNKARCISIVKAMTPFYDKKDYGDGLSMMVDSVSKIAGVTATGSMHHDFLGIIIGGLFIAVVLIGFVVIRNKKKPLVV